MRAGRVGCQFGRAGPPASLSFVVRRYPSMNTKLGDSKGTPPSGITGAHSFEGQELSPPEEYKALRDEIMLYQQEMHRTWLWAIVPSGAIYTWLPLHLKQASVVAPPGVWFIPVLFVSLCFVRYLAFWYRIDRLAQYQSERYGGIARWNLEDPHLGKFLPNTCRVWAAMVACCVYLSCALSGIPVAWSIVAACLVLFVLAPYSSRRCSNLLRPRPKKNAATSVVSPPAATTPPTST
jgi:hypothetical protein